jgi:hypothetical protein
VHKSGITFDDCDHSVGASLMARIIEAGGSARTDNQGNRKARRRSQGGVQQEWGEATWVRSRAKVALVD